MINLELLNVRWIARRYPGSFELPAPHNLATLIPGERVRVATARARFWVEIVEREAVTGWRARVVNDLVTESARLGDFLAIDERNILQIHGRDTVSWGRGLQWWCRYLDYWRHTWIRESQGR